MFNMPAVALVAPNRWAAVAPPYTTATCRELHDYYLEARGAGLLLPHAKLDPARLGSLLPRVMLFEMLDGETGRIRLCGTAFRQWFGSDLTGRNWLDLSHPSDRAARQRRMTQAVLQPCGIRSQTWQFREGMPRRKFEALTLPLEPRYADGPPVMLIAMAEVAPAEGGPPPELLDFERCRRVDWSFVDLGAGVPDPSGW